ncbi:dephospho-CoA kinase [Lacticaseibacillus baoqingensis]|uniref:Dephospho-CoA kinase n=1 Tax=Lacticaseibacillus baoqingensis TaxID=2486013 RepID=A0ABW4E422_9LACO|nr:dephospho-CoA kinase [Lacticaseibacillus baoqingensis]
MTYLLGLTGGIATGKSTVAAAFKAAGFPVVSADVIARKIVEPGQPALAAIVAEFGPETLLPDGHLNRRVLGQRVFADPQALAKLNAIDQPYLREAIIQALQAAKASGKAIVVGEIPLLFESHFESVFDGVAVVTLPPHLQRQRLMARDGLDEIEAQQRIDAQMPLAEKIAKADFLIDNSQGPAVRLAQVTALIAHLTR